MKTPQQYLANAIQKQIQKQIKAVKPVNKRRKSRKKKSYTATLKGIFGIEMKLVKQSNKKSQKQRKVKK